MTRNAAGMPVSPVVAYAVGMTPAATVSGATPARTKNSTAGTPSRSRASARDTLLGLLPAVCGLGVDIRATSCWRIDGMAWFRRGATARRCRRRSGSGRSGPAGWGRAAATASWRRWRAVGGRYSASWRPSPQAAASPARAASAAVTGRAGSRADLTRSNGANAQSGLTGIHRGASRAAAAREPGTPRWPAGQRHPRPRCGPETPASRPPAGAGLAGDLARQRLRLPHHRPGPARPTRPCPRPR